MPTRRLLALPVFVVLVVGIASFVMGQSAPTIKPPSVNASQVGRYQIFTNPNVRADTFLLDTETGSTWAQTQITDATGTPTIWVYRERVDNEQQFTDWAKRQTFTPGKK
jgi:hypothetical protein